jgi:hypothetical protein
MPACYAYLFVKGFRTTCPWLTTEPMATGQAGIAQGVTPATMGVVCVSVGTSSNTEFFEAADEPLRIVATVRVFETRDIGLTRRTVQHSFARIVDISAIACQALRLAAFAADAGEPVAAIVVRVVRHARLAAFAFVRAGHQVAHLVSVVDKAAFVLLRQAVSAAAVQLVVTGVPDATQAGCDVAVFICPAGAAQAALATEDVVVCTWIVERAAGVLRATGHATVAARADQVRSTLAGFGAGVSFSAWIAAGHDRATQIAQDAAGAFGASPTAADAVVGTGQVPFTIEIGIAGCSSAAGPAAVELRAAGIADIAALVIAAGGLAADAFRSAGQAGLAVEIVAACLAAAAQPLARHRAVAAIRNEPAAAFRTTREAALPR